MATLRNDTDLPSNDPASNFEHNDFVVCKMGARVIGLYKDQFWKTGQIVGISKDQAYDVSFDDGTESLGLSITSIKQIKPKSFSNESNLNTLSSEQLSLQLGLYQSFFLLASSFFNFVCF